MDLAFTGQGSIGYDSSQGTFQKEKCVNYKPLGRKWAEVKMYVGVAEGIMHRVWCWSWSRGTRNRSRAQNPRSI